MAGETHGVRPVDLDDFVRELACREDVGRDTGRLRALAALAQQLEDFLRKTDRAALVGVAHLPSPVPGPRRDDPADAAAGIRDVTVIARDHVEMGVGNGLPCGLTDIQADVVAIRRPLGFD